MLVGVASIAFHRQRERPEAGQASHVEITLRVGEDLLGLMDDLRVNDSTALFPRIPDNDGDSLSNADELAIGRDPNFREVVLALGDVNLDGTVDCDDLDGYIENFGTAAIGELAALDIDSDGTLNAADATTHITTCLLYTSPSPRDKRQSRMPSSA